jgi:DUF4097 and DUF4098 domain-containing protein YvlB
MSATVSAGVHDAAARNTEAKATASEVRVSTPAPPKVSERFEKLYSLNLDGSVKAMNISGDIKLTTWESPQVRLIAIKTASDEERMKDLSLEIDSDASTFSVRAKYRNYDKDEDGNWGDRGHLSVSYELTVPSTAVLKGITSVSGDVSIDGARNRTSASSVSGDVTGRNLGGAAKLSSVSGGVEADFSTVESGSDIRLSTVSGEVNLRLPSYVGARFSASTVSGEISNDFGVEVEKGKYVGNSMNGVVGDGSIEVKLSSVSGKVRVTKE